MDETVNARAEKYMITGVKVDGKVLWETEAHYVESVLIPVKYRGYKIESLIRDGWVHMRMVGRHKQNSREIKVNLADISISKNHHIIHMNGVLFPLADGLAEEDKLFDAFTGKADKNG